MSRFLTHLAGIALGRPVEGAAHPLLPPRYARPEAGGLGREAIRAGELLDERPPIETFAATEPPDREPRDPGGGSDCPVAPAGEPASPPPSEASADLVAVAPAPRSSRPLAARPAKQPRRPHEVAAPSAVWPDAPPELDAASPPPLPESAPAPAQASVLAVQASHGRAAAVPAARRAAAPSDPSETPFAPLSDGAVASRSAAARQVAPAVHVTIDRIDVRAPAPARPAPAARRAPVEPRLSLSDFLAAGPPGPRR
ncbi:MAG TPA: hypothetical protein VEX35_12315 [Allosphingosinicella sp.]|nr:hypothetical protein [Allosphingosinicella sp.]